MKRIVLIGFAGTFKSSAGRLLAARLGVEHFDTDAMVEEVAGCTIAEIVENCGEDFFRQREAVVVQNVPHDNCVVSTGGGTLLCADNAEKLKAASLIVWLTANVENIYDRIKNDEARPLHIGKNVEQLRIMLREREPAYRRYAHCTIATDGKTPDSVVDAICEYMDI
jgi:shikimate kinase